VAEVPCREPYEFGCAVVTRHPVRNRASVQPAQRPEHVHSPCS